MPSGRRLYTLGVLWKDSEVWAASDLLNTVKRMRDPGRSGARDPAP